MSVNKETIKHLSSSLAEAVKDFTHSSGLSPEDDATKRKAISTAAGLLAEEATLPEEQWEHEVSVLTGITAQRMFLEWKAFDLIPQSGDISWVELAKKIGADEGLVRRFGNMLISYHVLACVGEDRVKHTPKSLIYHSSTSYYPYARMLFDEGYFVFMNMPRFFKQYPLVEPVTEEHSPLTFANGRPKETSWDIIHETPERMRTFMEAMRTADGLISATKVFDYGLIRDAAMSDPKRPVVVEVGGSRGHSLQAIMDVNSWIPRNRCYLQDQPEIIEEVNRMDVPGLREVTKMAHDFYKEQPIKGALIYHIRRCLHDYGDDICITIMRQLANAMAPDSRLLIVEVIVGNPPESVNAFFDLAMLGIGGKERSRREFEHLAKAAGLRVKDVWQAPWTPVGVVECVKA